MAGAVGQRGPCLGGVGGAGDVADQAGNSGTVFAGDHHGLIHAIQTGQG